MSLEVSMCCLDLTHGAVLSSDPKQNKSQKIVSFPKSVARFTFQSTQSKIHSILGQRRWQKNPWGRKGVQKVTDLNGS